MDDDKLYLTGLWERRSKGGARYLTGKLGRARLLLFRNERKQSDASPDYSVFLVPDDRDVGGGDSEPAGSTRPEAPPGPPITDEAVPF
jgi:hypothetical protein